MPTTDTVAVPEQWRLEVRADGGRSKWAVEAQGTYQEVLEAMARCRGKMEFAISRVPEVANVDPARQV